MHARSYIQIALMAAVTAATAACALLDKRAVGRVAPGKASAPTRWDGALSTPGGLTGARGEAGLVGMGPNQSWAVVSVTNAAPQGLRVWHVYQGQCGDDGAAVGPTSAYPLLKVDKDGYGASSALLPLRVPGSGAFYVIVEQSSANARTAAVCGNLAVRKAG